MTVTGDLASVERRIAALAGTPPGPRAVATVAVTASGFHDAEHFRSAVAAASIADLVRDAARAAHVDPALALAVAQTESHLDPAARSAAGAIGVMQLMPATAQALGVENPYDPAQNVRGGTLYLRELLDRFGGDVRRAVAAYNAGPAAVAAYGGVPPFAETRAYVERVLARM